MVRRRTQRGASSKLSPLNPSEDRTDPNLPTLLTILNLPAFKVGELVSGYSQLHRRVSWVHVAEILDISRFLAGGEFLLSTGIELARARTDKQVAFLRSLITAGATGLGIELVNAIKELPQAVLEAARQAQFPLVLFHAEVSFAGLTRAAHERILLPRRERLEEPGLDPILDALIETGRDREFLQRQLGPVLSLPRKQRSVLLATLAALIESHYNIAEAARSLSVRRQSVYYRMAQLAGLIGSLDDPQRKAGFLIAIALLRRNQSL